MSTMSTMSILIMSLLPTHIPEYNGLLLSLQSQGMQHTQQCGMLGVEEVTTLVLPLSHLHSSTLIQHTMVVSISNTIHFSLSLSDAMQQLVTVLHITNHPPLSSSSPSAILILK